MLQILEVAKEDEGAYRCVASNSARKDISHEARLIVTIGEVSLCYFTHYILQMYQVSLVFRVIQYFVRLLLLFKTSAPD